MSDDTGGIGEPDASPAPGPDALAPPDPPPDDSPYEIQPLDVVERGLDREGTEARHGD